MIALCHHCGETKPHPLQACQACRSIPQTEVEMAQSLLLTDSYLDQNALGQIATILRSGNKVNFGEEVMASVIQSIRQARTRPMAAPRARGIKGTLIKAGIFALLIALLVAYFHPTPQYEFAKYQDTISSYQAFLERFPFSEHYGAANERLRVLRDDIVWEEAIQKDSINSFRFYAQRYPDGKHLADARQRIVKLADAEWAKTAQSRSETELLAFLKNYPETTQKAAAEGRIQALNDDLAWVKEQDNLARYQKFAERFPSHPDIAWIQKRIIDLEVQQIAAGDYGTMPEAQATTRGGSVVRVEVENETGYELTVRYSGPESKKLVIPIAKTGHLSLQPGNYQVAASVTAASVTNYYGQQTMQGGEYASNFYIETSTTYGGSGSSFSIPRFSGSKKRR